MTFRNVIALVPALMLVACGRSANPAQGKTAGPGERVVLNDCSRILSGLDEGLQVATAPASSADCGDTIGVTAAAPAKLSAAPRVVVADLDSAINPYHAFYHETVNKLIKSPIYPAGSPPSSVTPEVLAEFGIDEAHILTLTRTGRLSKDIEADAALWANVKPRELYWFRGTNIIATSYLANPGPGNEPLRPVPGKNPHGVGTSGAVLIANPEAIILFVETNDSLGSQAPHEFAFLHPLVDIVTTSYGYGVGVPGVGGTGAFPPEPNGFYATFNSVVRMGKLHFSSGGNSPGLTPFRGGAGPWWSIGVSGSQEDEASHAREPQSGLVPDFVSDFTQTLPYCLDCETAYDSVGGTSFSTPRAAGVASRVLLETRRALGHAGGIAMVEGQPVMAAGVGRTVSNWQIRRALEVAAYVPTTAEAATGDVPVNDVEPWLQVGWGDLTADPAKGVVLNTLGELGLGGVAAAAKAAGFCDWQTKVIEARREYWNNVSPEADAFYDAAWPTIGPTGETVVGALPEEAQGYVGYYVPGAIDFRGDPAEPLDHDPFIYCGSTLPSP